MTAAQYAALRALRPALAQWCERLAASAVPPSLDHSDLHDYQVFVSDGRYTFFDWGDASIGHPFTSLLVILRAAAARHGLARVRPRSAGCGTRTWSPGRPGGQRRNCGRMPGWPSGSAR